MRSEKYRVGTLAGGATLGLIVMLGIQPVSVERIVAGYVLLLATIGLASLIRVLGERGQQRPASQFAYLLERKPEQPARPPELLRIEREIALGTANAAHLNNRLLPLLRDVASARLGFELEQRPDAARARLGDSTWDVLRPDRPEPAERTAPGLPLRVIRETVGSLERA